MAGRRGSVSSSGVQLIVDQPSMATVNNWLGFSLSPQELPSSAANAGDVSGADVCFNIPQDWSMRGSELSALVAEPKLEDFLGGISSYSDQHRKAARSNNMNINGAAAACYASSGASGYRLYQHHPTSANSLQFADSVMVASSAAAGVHNEHGIMASSAANGTAGTNGGIGLSMIKSWLRSQPAPERVEGLSLSMNMPLLQQGGGERLASDTSLSTSAAQQGSRKENNGSSSAGSGAVVSAGTTSAGAVVVESPSAGRKTADTFGQRTSIYRGVTRHRWTGRYEAHLWDNSCRREGQTRKGRQVYLGGYDKEEKAARAYDLAALKYWGPTTTTNFPVDNYEKELEEMKHMTRQEFVASLRRKSSGFSRGASIYRGVTRHHQHGRWQARIGRVAGNKDLYLGTFSTQEEAAEAYDIAAIKFRGLNAVTNFDMSRYDVKSILDSTAALPVGGTKRLRDAAAAADQHHQQQHAGGVVSYGVPQLGGVVDTALTYGTPYYHQQHHASTAATAWPTIAFQAAPPQAASGHGHMLYHPYGQQPLMRGWCKQEQEQGQVQQQEPDHAVIAAAHSLQDLHHLNLGAGAGAGAGAHDFFSQHAAHAMHQQQQHGGLGSVDNNGAASLEHSTGSNSVVYNGAAAGDTNNSYMLPPMSAAAAAGFGLRDQQDDGGKMAYENFLLGAAADGYGGSGRMAATWTPVSVSAAQPVVATSSGSDMAGAVYHGGAQLFSVWNDDS